MKCYKFSRYNHYGTLRDNTVLLWNYFSASVAILEQSELDHILNANDSCNDDLCMAAVAQGFLVPADEDEVAKLLALRNANNFNEKRAGFQVLPTTGCNARCFYCYEHGFQPSTMTLETADAVVSFILDYCENMDDVAITWFGGEPFVCEDIMAYISSKLIPKLDAAGKRYNASVITNASLITQENILKIVDQYRIRSVQVTLDGKGSEHLRRKGYLDQSMTYEKVIDTISLLTNHGIKVMVRINIDRDNLDSCIEAIDDLAASSANQELLWPYASPLYSDRNGVFCLTKSELNDAFEKVFRKMIDCGFIQTIDGLPLNFSNAVCCAKMLNNYVIAPNGDISKCEHLLNIEEEVVGSVFDGIRFNAALAKWTSTAVPEECLHCNYLPICQAGCAAAEQRGFGYGRCSHVVFVHDAIVSAANYLLFGKGGTFNDNPEKQ